MMSSARKEATMTTIHLNPCYKPKPLSKTATGMKMKPTKESIPTIEQQTKTKVSRPMQRPKSGNKNKSPPGVEEQRLLLQQVFDSLSTQSEELLLNEQLWDETAKEKRLAKSCMNPIGRSSGVKDTFPTVKKAKDWAEQKDFWLSYLPRQQRIWEYESGENGQQSQYWRTSNRIGDMDLLEELQIDGRTGQPISFEERCQRYERQLEWEEKLMTQYDKAAIERNNKFKGRDNQLTLSRYKDFGKRLMNNLKQVQNDTKNLEFGHTNQQRNHLSEMKRLETGYNNLKSIFELDSTLVYTLAEEHLKGSLGNRWMGLSRDDVRQVLQLLEKSKKDPSFCPFPLNTDSTSLSLTNNGVGGGSLCKSRPASANCATAKGPCLRERFKGLSKNSNPPKSPIKVKGQSRSDKPLKPSQLMPLHIPGPDSVRQNILIRAYTAEMDGRPEEDLELDLEEVNSCGGGGKKKSSKVKRSERKLSAVDLLARESLEASTDEDEGITIESFIPFYSVTRT